MILVLPGFSRATDCLVQEDSEHQQKFYLASNPAKFFAFYPDTPPALPDSFQSSNGHFIIHFTTQGKDSISSTDINQNSFPDRIETIAEAFERSYEVEIQHLNYNHPPSMNNGTTPYHVYVIDLHNNFALTVPTDVDSNSWEQKNVSSFILFDNDFKGPGFHIQGEDAIRVTAAHEFFHAIQLGYVFRKKDAFFFELSAVWMEDQVFDEIDNYLYFLDYFFSAPDIPLNGVSYTIPNVMKHIYGSCIFGFYIAENFGVDAIRQIWLRMPDKPALEAMNDVFRNYNSNFEKEFVKFSKWNFFTGERTLPDFSYDNGTAFPEVKTTKDTLIDFYHEALGAGYFLTAAYYLFHPYRDGTYNINFSAEKTSHWRLGVIVYDDKIVKNYSVIPGQAIDLGTIKKQQDVVVIVCNVDRFADPDKIFFKENPENYSFVLRKERQSTPGVSRTFKIINCYPNPFANAIRFTIQKFNQSPICISIYNIKGQLINQIQIEDLSQEVNHILLDRSQIQDPLPSGIYFFKFSDDTTSEVLKIFLTH